MIDEALIPEMVTQVEASFPTYPSALDVPPAGLSTQPSLTHSLSGGGGGGGGGGGSGGSVCIPCNDAAAAAGIPLTGLAIARHFMRPRCGWDGYSYM